MADALPAPALVADMGGTNARLALARDGRLLDDSSRLYKSSDCPGPLDAVARFVEELGESLAGARACIAVASPVAHERVRDDPDYRIAFTNSPWTLAPSELKRAFAIDRLAVINDFEAQAYALPQLTDAQLEPLGTVAQPPDEVAPLLVIGPGTGFGAALWLPRERRAICSEGGQIAFAPADKQEAALLSVLWRDDAHVPIERILSGAGIELLHRSLHDGEALPAEAISRRAAAATCPRCEATMAYFFAILGSAAGDLALATGARGGVHLGGGILPRVAAALHASAFLDRFTAKGEFGAYLRAIPVWLITANNPGLIGAAAAAEYLC